MGVAATHYVVLGVALTNKAQIKKFFRISEEHLDFCDKYDDNGYKDKPTPTESGIHMIVDGMSSNYIVVGKILSKGLEEGMPFTQLTLDDNERDMGDIFPELRKIDRALGTDFSDLPLQYIAFTHWH